MRKIIIAIFAVCVAATTGICAEAANADGFKFSAAQEKNRFYKDFKKWDKRDKDVINDKNAVLCIGSSSMRMWKTIAKDLAPLKVIHCGFGGSRMAQVLLFKDFFLRYKADRVVIYEGDNDMMGNFTPEKYLKQCKVFCNDIFKLRPKTNIWFISTKPSIRRWKTQPKYNKVNELVKKYCESDPRLHYIDVVTPMLGKDGTPRKDIFLKDNLHMNKKGYEIWTKQVREALIK